ncbi:prepilin-type N-terminal cleavage/methylation domain-containing protein [Seleniivibrio woodruffii]|uniref:prepilin-type N-terminal cleavage/methylation domain-containing protein n=1 Tax=Seleniivibrio woodruffii TaxID=1078050 RepID=UPI0026EA4641|nr:type II secretion system protein [Seleniivibrio woodruffii]
MNKKGFTLLELAIVLIIVGVLSAGAMKILFGAFNNNKQTATRNNIALIVKDIAAYTVKGRRLPATLDRATSQTSDTFGRALVYEAAENLEDTDICSVQTTDMSINGAVTENNIAFLVISTGEDGQQQYTESDNTYTFNNGNDDVVGWMNLGTLQAMAGCDGSLSIEQNKLPDAIVSNTYSFKLTPKGGTSPYKWCVESDNSETVKDQMYFGTGTGDTSHEIKNIGDCTSANGVTNNTITLHSAADPLEIAESDSGSALIKVRLEDANGITITKNYNLQILREFEVAMAAPESGGNGSNNYVDVVSTGGNSFVANDTTSGGVADSNTAIVNSDQIKLVQNSNTRVISVLYNCSANPTSASACPKFGNKGLISTYFTVEYYRNPSAWQQALGFTFTIIKSYVAGTSYTSTVKMTGSGDAGLGYGGSGGDHKGIKAGNSFAIEFDLQNDGKNDINNNHMAIVSYANINNYDGTWDNKGNFNNNDTFTAYGDNVHDTLSGTRIYATTYNDRCGSNGINSGVKGFGCYYNNSDAPIVNSYDKGEKMGVRLEAIGGCNSSGTACTGLSGSSNYTCVYVWKYNMTELNSNSILKAAMTDQTAHYVYDKLINGTAYPTGDPLLKDCFPDNTTYAGTLDYFRYGFTTSNYYSSSSQLYYDFTDFFLSSGQYTP